MSLISNIWDEVFQAIQEDKDDGLYSLEEFHLSQSLDRQSLETLVKIPRVVVIGLAYDEERLTRREAFQGEFPIQVAFQYANQKTTPEIERTLLRFIDELRKTCRTFDSAFGYAHLRTESFKDENELPYSFSGLREGGVFETYFTAYYKKVIIDD
jgi:hypothetical protein